MKISEFIKRLKELKAVAGDVEVGLLLDDDNDTYEEARAEIATVTPIAEESVLRRWVSLDEGNTEQIVTVW